MQIYLKKISPIVGASILVLVLLCTGALKIDKAGKFCSIFAAWEVSCIDGSVANNTTLVRYNQSRYLLLKLSRVHTYLGDSADARSLVSVHIPQELLATCGRLDKGICLTIYGEFKKDVFQAHKIVVHGYGNSILSVLYQKRSLIRSYFLNMAEYWGEAGSLFLALIIGIRDSLDDNIMDAFRSSGLSFILALSGMHLAILAVFILFISKGILGRRCGYGIAVLVISVFVFLVGGFPSLIRSYIFFMMTIVFTLLDIQINVLDRVALTFLLHTATFPSDFATLSFQLSYLAVVGIVLLAPFCTSVLSKILPQKIALLFAGGLAANIMTAPLVLKTFGMLAPIGIVAGAIITPLIMIFMVISLLSVLAYAVFPPLDGLCFFLLDAVYTIIKILVYNFARVPVIYANLAL